jgi:glycosyltransferase involved in cell wall biosynthesis
VVGKDVGNMREVIKQKETGWVISSNQSYQELANKLAFFLDGNQVVSTALCRAAVIPFGWPNIAHKISQVLSNLPQLTPAFTQEV